MTPVHRMISTLARLSEVAFGGLFSKESLSVNIWTTVKISRVEKLKMVVEAPPPKKKRSLPSASQVVIVTDGANGAVLCRNRSGDFWMTVPMISYDHFLSLLVTSYFRFRSLRFRRMWLLATSLRHLLGRTRAPSSRHDGWAVRMGMGSLIWILNPVSARVPEHK